MPNYNNDLKGVLYKNERAKRKGKKDPDMTGHVIFDRKELIKLIKLTKEDELKFWISGWHGKSKKGDYYMSLKLNPAEVEEEEEEEEEDDFLEETPPKKKGKKKPSSDDDLPF